MGSTTLVSVERYLSTSYRPDCDYVEGEVVERNVGEVPHSLLQGFFRDLFTAKRQQWGLVALPEVRLQVSESRFRIPDLSVLKLPLKDPRIVRTAPMLCIEIFSSEDRMSRMQERVTDYRRMGVSAVWALDPWRRMAYAAGEDGILHEVTERLAVPDTSVGVDVQDVFAELDLLSE